MYDRAVAAAHAEQIPPFVTYTSYAAFERKGGTKAELFRVVMRTADGHTYARRLPAAPGDRVDPAPHASTQPLYRLSPFNLFFVHAAAAGMPMIGAANAAATPPPTIASVTAVARAYAPTLLPDTVVDGRPAVHLHLEPIVARTHPVRELYLDPATMLPIRVVFRVDAAIGPARAHPDVTVDYRTIGGTDVIASMHASFAFRMLFVSYGGAGDFRTSDVEFTPVEPAWLFDELALAKHAAQGAALP